ncbi:hypothetical protein COLO4_30556 [Corchorus olitorius]|uniref:Malectin-like domain-containing protein n=1 Tax=Corchorus olitorius TaxID=93759 RepID=A0A1R3H7U0_9ROSI|nr:hypothetical protein COLO4_30556 [Corchorus olitorius]
MNMRRHFLLVLLSNFALAFVIHAQDQSGFISLDCGSPEGTSYTESTTGIKYVSDSTYVQTGESHRILPAFRARMQQQAIYLRSFPEGERNCYTLTLRKGDKYLIRATFMYGNYDEKNELPSFDAYLGPTFWGSVIISNASVDSSGEMIHVLESDYLQFCLVNTGKGTPFISALELRLLKNTSYSAGSMALFQRYDVCSTSKSSFSTNPKNQFYVYLHFVEIQELGANQSREFNVFINGELWLGPYRPRYLKVDTAFSITPLSAGLISIERTENSTLPPILNAMEIYTVLEFLELQTADIEVDAITKIKSMYGNGMKRNWQGDPCTPQGFVWEGLNCSYNNDSFPRIISLDLSSSGLTGEIPPYLANLTHLQNLDLSNNNLTGPIPEFLSKLQSLTILNLNQNQLNGSIPAVLVERSNNATVASVASFTVLITALASVASFTVLITALALLWRFKRRRTLDGNTDVNYRNTFQSEESKTRQFKYSEILKMTNNFERVLGKGGFGTVFHGYLGDTQVAVKMLSASSAQGYKQFQAEEMAVIA